MDRTGSPTPTRVQDATHLGSLVDLSQRALHEDDPDAFARAACATLGHELGVPKVGVFRRSEDGAALLLHAGVGWVDGEVGALALPLVADDPILAGPLIFGRTDGPTPSPSMIVALGDVRGVSVPISYTQGTWGILLAITHVDSHAVTDQDLLLIRATANLVAGSIHRSDAESSLRSSQHRMELAQEIAHMGSYDWEVATDTTTWSDELFRIYGVEPGAFQPSFERFLSLVHPDDRARVEGTIRDADASRADVQMEERIVRPDGSERLLLTNGRVITDDEGNPERLVGICFDITEQRQAELEARRYAAMRLAQRQALEINDNVVQGIATAVLALESNQHLLALDAARNTLAAARSMMNDLLDDWKVDQAVEAGELVRVEPPTRILPDPPVERPVTGPNAIRLVIADDSDDMRLMLRMSMALDPRVNVVGVAADGEQVLDVIATERPDAVLLDLAMPRRDGLEAIPLLRERYPDLKIIVLSGFDASRMRDQALDIGADRFIEKGARPQQLVDELCALFPERSLSAPDEPVQAPPREDAPTAHLLHELRTPATVLQGLITTLRESADSLPSSAAGEIMDALGRNAELITRLINDVDEARRARTEGLSIHPERTDIAELAHQVRSDLATITAGHTVRIDAEDDVVAPVDPFRIRQVLTNLVSNAAKFSPPNTTITIRIMKIGPDVVVMVRDEGPGIPPGRRDDLFKEYSRLGATGSGLGLGLYLSKAIARQHGGDLLLDTTSGPPGATFVLVLRNRVDD